MKIGIITESFVGLSGANDFLKHIIYSLDLVAKEQNLELYILLKAIEYRRYKGLKRWLCKHQEPKRLKNIFKEFKNIKKIVYTQDVLDNVITQYHLDAVLPDTKLRPYSIPVIGYLYDCQHRHIPELFTEDEINYRNWYFGEMVKSHHKIMVNAHTVKEDLINFFGAQSEQIFVLPYTPKIDLRFYDDYSQKIKKYHLPARYFMMSNQFWIHKDHPTALRAFAQYLKTDSNMEFIFTGAMEDSRRPEYIQELKQLVKELNIEDKVHFLGLIPKEEQIQIMKGATALIQTTLFEGGPGGGSVYDAAALGIPAIVSDIKTNQEIQYDRVHFFKAQDVQDLCRKMQDVVKIDYPKISVEKLKQKSEENMKILGQEILLTLSDINKNYSKMDKI